MGERRSLLGIASVVGVATAASKALGLARSMVVAAVFGVGAVADAHAFAALVPGFFLVVLAGQNGPLQSALVSVLSQDEAIDQRALIGWTRRRITLVLLPVCLAVVAAAGPLLTLLAPGLDGETHRLAVLQLRLMAPIVPLSGWIGVGMARLISAGVYGAPSLSPMLSSAAVIAAAAVVLLEGRWWPPGTQGWRLAASATLALGTVLGALLQWGLQALACRRLVHTSQADCAPAASVPATSVPAERGRVLALLLPSTLASALGAANATVDLVFASFLPGVAASLGYAEVLAQAPRGLVASMLLVPLLPAFARLAGRQEAPQLRQRVIASLRITAFVAIPLAALVAVLAEPLVATLYQRRAFDVESTRRVASLLQLYGIGLLPSLLREVMVRFFYGLGDGATPFRIGLVGIAVNGALDAALVRSLGAPGLVLASVGVNLVAVLLMGKALERALGPFPWPALLTDLLVRMIPGVGAALVGGGAWRLGSLLPGADLFPVALLRLALAAAAGVAAFVALAPLLGIEDGRRILRGRS